MLRSSDSFGAEFWRLFPPPKSVKKTPSPSIHTVTKWFADLGFEVPHEHQISGVLWSEFAKGDLVKCFELIRWFQQSSQGHFLTNEPFDTTGNKITYVGADNWENVMCYMDALLFAMFANLDSFEPMLFVSNKSTNPIVNRLCTLLRVYVNLLRSGNVISVDLTHKICVAASQLGFKEALSHKQQDAASLFEFLTEALSMPLLTFKIDIKHGGKFEADDEKYSKERILFVSVPESETEDDILLEECLETYFNNSVSVRREIDRQAIANGVITESEIESGHHGQSGSDKDPGTVSVRTRSSTLSIWSNSTVNNNNNPVTDSTSSSTSTPTPTPTVSLPAWMFLRLLPFYTDDSADIPAQSSREFATTRPVLPICLKRYSYDEDHASRLQRKVIIPPVINLPYFVADNHDHNVNYKLVLESAICHRGTLILSGHFVAAVRKNYYTTNETDDEAYSNTWYLYDDMHKPKVQEFSFSHIFDTEWPYILFYRLIQIDLASTASSMSDLTQVVVPPGSKGNYWDDEQKEVDLQKDLSQREVDLQNDIPQKPTPQNDLPQKPTPQKPTPQKPTPQKPTPQKDLPHLPLQNLSLNFNPPDSPSFIDISSRYYWYLPDKYGNYYKQTTSTHSSHKPSLTRHFRRNSQWSSISIGAKDLKSRSLSPIRLQFETEHLSRSKTVENKVKLKKGDHKSDHKSDHKHHHKHRHLHSRRKRDAYTKDKCVIA